MQERNEADADASRVQAKCAIERMLGDIDALVSTNVIAPDKINQPIARAAIAYILILLNDCLWLSANVLDYRIDDRGDHVHPTGKERDLTALIAEARNASCHVGSPLKNVLSGAVDFIVVVGQDVAVTMTTKTDDGLKTFAAINPYPDDTAIFWGELRLLIVENLKLAFDRLIAKYSPKMRLHSGIS